MDKVAGPISEGRPERSARFLQTLHSHQVDVGYALVPRRYLTLGGLG